jgi:hypothetical protein
LHDRVDRHASAQNADGGPTEKVTIPLARLFMDRNGVALVEGRSCLLFGCAVYQHEAEMWKVDVGKLKYVRDVRGARTTW